MAVNTELRRKVSGSFSSTDDTNNNLLYLKTHSANIAGLLDGNGKILDALVPDAYKNGLRYGGAVTQVTRTTDELRTAINSFVSGDADTSTSSGVFLQGGYTTHDYANYVGVWEGGLTSYSNDEIVVFSDDEYYKALQINNDSSPVSGSDTADWQYIGPAPFSGTTKVTVSTGHTVKLTDGTDATATDEFWLQNGDWLLCTNDAATAFSVKSNRYNLVTTLVPGLISAEDKTKLDGIDASANNYTHPTQSTINLSPSATSRLANIVVNNLGHVTSASLEVIQNANTSAQYGLTTLQDSISTATDRAVTPNVVNTVNTDISTHVARTDDPHQITATQLSLENLQNWDMNTLTDMHTPATNKYSNPLGVATEIDSFNTIPLYSNLTTANNAAGQAIGNASYVKEGRIGLITI